MKQCKGGFEIAGAEEFNALMDNWIKDPASLAASGKNAGNYVSAHAGALDKIMKTVQL